MSTELTDSPTTGTSAAPENLAQQFQSLQEQLRVLAESGSVKPELLTSIQTLTTQLGGMTAAAAADAMSGSSQLSSSLRAGPTALAATGGSGTAESSAFYDQLQGIPIDYLISTPLISAARGNIALATVMTEFINTIGFNSDGSTNVLSFILDQPYQNAGASPPTFETATITVNAPLLSLVPLPALLVQGVTIDLAVQISNVLSNVDTSSQTSTAGATVNASYGWGFGKASFAGTYTNTNSNTVTNSQTASQAAQYTINVVAEQQPPTAGMLALSQIFANCIVPTQIGATGG